MNLTMIFELTGFIEFDRGRRLSGFDFSRVERLAIVIGGGCVLCQRGVGPCDGIARYGSQPSLVRSSDSSS